MSENVDLSGNLYDMTTYAGRASHFYRSVNPLNLFKDHVSARDVVSKVKLNGGAIPEGLTKEDVWNSKYIYDSAYHPTTGELVFMPGRMSFQAPGNCIIASGMLIFYKTPIQAISGQLINQSFNSTVNYSNAPVPNFDAKDFGVAAGSACFAAYGMNMMAKKYGSRLMMRLVPFAAVCVANFINLPYMRRDEIWGKGMPMEDKDGKVVAHSSEIGKWAVLKVVLCRIIMATPTMVIPPIVIEKLSKPGRLLAKHPSLVNPMQVALIGLALVVATPAACAIWPQRDSALIETLEADVQQKLIKDGFSLKDTLTFNKGL